MATFPASVLFACNLNRVRSPMAVALARSITDGSVVADSCGLAAAEGEDPFMVVVLAEIGVTARGHAPKTFDDLDGRRFDLVVSLTPEAHARALALPKTFAGAVEHWPTEDPMLETGAREQRLEAYRAVRDALRRRIAERFGPSTGEAGSG